MQIQIDSNNLLVIENESIPQTKEYTYTVGWYKFSDFDKWIIVLHKKDWKIINLKNLGDGMSVVYIRGWNVEALKRWNVSNIENALQFFEGFDENTGEKYYFIPGLGEAQQQEKNEMLQKLWTAYTIHKTEKGMKVVWTQTTDKPASDAISLLFGLLCVYGKFDGKNGELSSIKIQLPLFWQYLAQQENLDQMIKSLQDEWIFLRADKLPNKNGIIYQISSNDYEFLEIFAKRYEAVEKFTKITKRDFTEDMKTRLIEFIQSNPEIPSAGKSEVLEKIKNGTIKLLIKN